MSQARLSLESAPKRGWLLGASALGSLDVLTASFRRVAISQVPSDLKPPTGYLPWMDSFKEYKTIDLLRPHQLHRCLLIDPKILDSIESAFGQGENALALILPEEKSFRILRDISSSPEKVDLYVDGIRLFASAGEYWQDLFATLCSFVVPIYSTREGVRAGGVGFSTLRARGAIFLSLPRDKEMSRLELAINLSHELGHQALMIYQGADKILNGDLDAPVYSVIRKTMRPAIWAFHGVVAISFMLNFLSDLASHPGLTSSERQNLETRYAELRDSLEEGLQLCENLEFTQIGLKIFRECQDLLLEIPEALDAPV